MDFGLYGLHRGGIDPRTLTRRARLAEQAGFDTVRRYADLGVDRLALQPADAGGAEIEHLITMVGDTVGGQP